MLRLYYFFVSFFTINFLMLLIVFFFIKYLRIVYIFVFSFICFLVVYHFFFNLNMFNVNDYSFFYFCDIIYIFAVRQGRRKNNVFKICIKNAKHGKIRNSNVNLFLKYIDIIGTFFWSNNCFYVFLNVKKFYFYFSHYKVKLVNCYRLFYDCMWLLKN